MVELYDIDNWCKNGIELINYPYIGSVDGDVNFGDVLKVENNYYSIGVFHIKDKRIGVHKLDINFKGEEQEYTSNCKCPYCGYEDIDSFELQDEEDNYKCSRCGGIYNYSRIVTIEYSSTPVKPPKTKKREWIKGV